MSEAAHEIVVISDSDVRVGPDYLRKIVAPLRDPKVGAVTCFYVPTEVKTFTDHLQTAGMMSDFYAGHPGGLAVGWRQVRAGTDHRHHARALSRIRRLRSPLKTARRDDLLVGRLIAEQGYEVVLLPYAMETVADYQSMRDLLHKRLRWIVVMRHMRPWGHLGLLFTQGLPWSLAAVAVHPTVATALALFRSLYGVARGDDVDDRRPRLAAAPLLEGNAADSGVGRGGVLHLADQLSARNSIRWRGADYYIRDGKLVPVKE